LALIFLNICSWTVNLLIAIFYLTFMDGSKEENILGLEDEWAQNPGYYPCFECLF
jgi:hypothetical protein